MEFEEITKRHIERVTGVPFAELLEKEPKSDPRLQRLRRNAQARRADPLVSGNPELAMGYVTTMAEIDAYWDEKMKEEEEG